MNNTAFTVLVGFLAEMVSTAASTKSKFVVGNILAILFFGLALTVLSVGEARANTSIDLSVSAYTWMPDPVVRGGTSTFTVTVTNNDVSFAADTLTLAIALPPNVDFSTGVTTASLPVACSLNAGSTTLTCTKATLAAQSTWTVSFDGVGATAGVQATTATISSTTNTDLNNGNDALTKNTTILSGADLTIGQTGPGGCITATPCNATAGSTIAFTVRVTNNGPDPATTFRVTDNLPAATDFTYQSATGAGWSCGVSGTTLTCDYSGANVASGNSAPDITVTGRIITTAGTITNGASVTATDSAVGDPVSSNNGPAQVVVNVAPGTDLRANKTMVSAATGMTSFATDEAVNLTLSATNQGPQNATGVTITDTVSADFTIGALPGGCSAAGQTITCTVGALGNGVTSTGYLIPLTVVGAAGNSGTNTANVARTGPTSGNNTPASVNYSLAAPFAHLTLVKTKTPTLVAAGANITNTITVTNSNSSTSAASGTIRVTDTLDIHENFVSFGGAGWSCSGVAVDATGMVVCDYVGANLARGASLPALIITTKAAAGWLGTITNTACTGQCAGSPHTPADNGSSSQSVSVTGTPLYVDLSVTKAASIASPTHVLTTDSNEIYTLTVSNAGPDVAPTVNVSDPIPGWYSGLAGTTGGNAVITGAGAGESCTFASTVSCTLLSLASGASRTITITVIRPFGDGSFTNTATVSTPDAIETNAADNAGSASIIVDPIADVAVTGIASAPNPVKVGVQLTYTTSIKNNGPSTAVGVVLRHTIDPARMTYVAGSASLTTGGSCSYVSSFVGAPYAGQAGIECNGFTLANGESRQLTFNVIPVYPYPDALDATYTSNATIGTTTVESSAANNSGANTVTITSKAIDLSVTDNDPGYDPTAFGDAIVYQVKAQNNGPSQATGFKLTVTPIPPALSQPDPYSMTYNAGGSSLPGGATCSQPGGAGTNVVCYLGADQAHSIQAAGSSATFNLMFDTGPLANKPLSSITYKTTAKVESYETNADFSGDTLSGNNSVTETTTVLPKTDLRIVSKAVSKPVVDLNETFTYTITVGNMGPSDASGVRVTDVLPAGLVRTAGAIVVTQGSGVSLAANSCSGPASGANGTVTCDLGPIPADTTGIDTTMQVAIAIPVRAAYQASGTYSFAFDSNITNTASIAPLPNTTLDTTPGNNSNTVVVQVRKSSIAGYVYADNNLDDVMDGGGAEGVGSVTLTLTGTDSYGYTYGSGMNYAARTTTTSATAGVNKGSFLFDKLPPGNWAVVETQPANYWDRYETVGTAGGTAPANTCDGSANCASAAAANTIGAIALPADTATAATGYIFQEYQRAQISGTVYSDANNDGVKAVGEPGIQSATAILSGTAYNGVNVCSLVTCAATTNASGVYSYANLPPADAGGYTLTETTPSGYLNGKTTAGTAGGINAVAGTATGANSDVIQAIKVYSNGNSINNNFGELQPTSLSGYVFIDANANALRDGTETTGLTGLTMTLTGTDDLGGAVNTTVNTGVSGAYSFTNLRPGTYQVDEPVIAGLTHTGLTVGSKAGDGGSGAVAANTAVTGAANRTISAITLAVGDAATNYNFGEGGQGLSGYVYVDLNNNGVKDAGEPGIAGVSVTLSGMTAGGGDVCAAISPNPCTVQTDTNGAYAFNGLPASNGSGYTLTEQSQAAAPLSNYGDGIDALGTVNGAATGSMADDRFSGIVIPVGGIGVSYNFGELGATLSGKIYLDADVGGTFNAGDSSIQNVTVTLSGNTASGADVCTIIASCSRTSDTNGDFSFAGLPASGAGANAYTLTETQPADYGDSANNLGTGATAAGTAGSNVFTGIQLGVAQNAIDYRFGEKAGAISGFVYLDANNDGIKLGATETGIAGVTLTITGTAAGGGTPCGLATCTTTTAADGSYSFTGLKNADGAGYTITETQPAAYIDGIVKKGTENGGACASGCVDTTPNIIGAIPFSANKTYAAFNFGELQGVSVAGRVWNDAQNNNGTYEAGEELAGVTLTLSGNDDRGAAVNATATTAVDGSYSFTGLRPSGAGGYTVTETQPAGIGNYAGTTGTQVGTIGGATTGSAGGGADAISGIALAQSGAAGINYNFRESASSLAGFVYLDGNDNGVKDAGETGIAGVVVTVTDGAALTRTATSVADGGYLFANLPSGSYTLTETHPSAYIDGRETAGSAGGTVDNGSFSAAAAQNGISAINLPVATVATGYLFGERPILNDASIGGRVYADGNNNGAHDAGEELAGVTLRLTGTDKDGGAVNLVVTTGADGTYSFTGLFASDAAGYTITETQPAGISDYPGTTGTQVGTIAAVVKGTAGTNVISAIVLPASVPGINYNFRENASSLNGFIYVDNNDNGAKDVGEAGIPGIAVTLSGTTTTGTDIATLRACTATPANCISTTDAAGAFSFVGIPPGVYTLVEDQNQVDLVTDAAGTPLYKDGKETAGVAGGTVSNSYFGSQAVYNTIDAIQLTSGVIAANAGNIGGYLFGEVARPGGSALGLLPPVVSGYVYADTTHTRTRGAAVADPLVTGWNVTLTATKSDGSTEVICTVQTDATGYYHLDNLACLANYPKWANGLPTTGTSAGAGVTYATFTVGFANPGVNGITTVPQSGGSAGTIDQATGQITAITLVPGADIVEQNLPLDPSGVVYDAVTRQPVAGAQVQILFGGALVQTACIAGGQNTVTTGTNGFYQFLLFASPGCPGSGVYTLAVTPPAGYEPGVSAMIPPTAGPYVPTIGGTDPIQAQNTAPSAAQATTYYLAINLTLTGLMATSSSNVVNNHIPVDPVTPGQILMTKTTPLVNVARGDLVPYTITAFNTSTAPLSNIAVHDLLPPGFKYRRGSGTVNGVATEPAVNGRDLTWNAQSFAANGNNTYKLILVVGSGVSDGAYVNQAYALRAGTAASNIASATVRVTPDPVFDCSDIIGKVFDDVNANGYQDDGEPGIPNVRMATARGLLVTSDADGRFHVACAAIPQADRGSNFVMKLDERTLPSGYRLTTENPRDARVTRGKMAKLNFGATIHRVVRLDITDGAFEGDGERLKPEWLARLQAMPEQLKGRPSVLRLAYKQGLAGEELAAARLKAVSAQLRALWNEKACCHALLIEEEIIQPSVVSGEGR